jgi:hypothetical protein
MVHTALIAAWVTTLALCAASAYIFGTQYTAAAVAVSVVATAGLAYAIMRDGKLIGNKRGNKRS